MDNQGGPAPIGFEMHDREAATAGQNGEFGFCNISVVQYRLGEQAPASATIYATATATAVAGSRSL